MSRAALLAAVIALVVLAGCSGSLGDAGATDREPYGVDDPVEPGAGYPPGLSPGGLDDPDALWSAHEEELEDRSYTVYSERYETDANAAEANVTTYGTVWSVTAIDRATGRTYVRERRSDGSDAVRTTERWFDENATFTRVRHPNGSVDYHEYPPVGEYPFYVGTSGERHLRAVLQSVDDPNVTAREDGTYVVEETTSVGPDEPVNVTIRVDADGVVRSAKLTETVEIDGERRRIREAAAVTAVDETDVAEPDWLDEAREEVGDGQSDVWLDEAREEVGDGQPVVWHGDSGE